MTPSLSASDTLDRFLDAVNRADVDAMLGFFEPGASRVAHPGSVVTGHEAIRASFDGMLGLRPTLKHLSRQLIEADDLVLCRAQWALSGTAPDGTPVQLQNHSADMLRRQADGGWRLVLDNPWGSEPQS